MFLSLLSSLWVFPSSLTFSVDLTGNKSFPRDLWLGCLFFHQTGDLRLPTWPLNQSKRSSFITAVISGTSCWFTEETTCGLKVSSQKYKKLDFIDSRVIDNTLKISTAGEDDRGGKDLPYGTITVPHEQTPPLLQTASFLDNKNRLWQ